MRGGGEPRRDRRNRFSTICRTFPQNNEDANGSDHWRVRPIRALQQKTQARPLLRRTCIKHTNRKSIRLSLRGESMFDAMRFHKIRLMVFLLIVVMLTSSLPI